VQQLENERACRWGCSSRRSGIVVAILKILEPMDYPAGDIRNSIEFRLIFYGLWIAFDLILVVAAARWLGADRRKPR
jgi:hypothetical protein